MVWLASTQPRARPISSILNNTSETVTTVDRTTQTLTATTTTPGVSTPTVQITCGGLLKSLRLPGLGAITFQYDGLAGETQRNDPRPGATTTTTYDPVFGQIASASSAQKNGVRQGSGKHY